MNLICSKFKINLTLNKLKLNYAFNIIHITCIVYQKAFILCRTLKFRFA